MEYLFIAIAPRCTLAQSYESELFDVLNECKQMTNAKLNCLK